MPPGGRSMAVPTTLHIGRPCMQCTPGRVHGPGGGAGLLLCRGLGEEGGGGRETRASRRGRGRAGGGEGRGGGAEASAGPHARQQRVGVMATPLVHSARGGGTCSTHMHASTRWKDWASTLVHISTRWRVRWVLRHCSQPRPRYQSRGYGSAAIAAPGPQRTYHRWCTRRIIAALALLLYCQPSPRYHRGAMGVQQPHSSCSARTAQFGVVWGGPGGAIRGVGGGGGRGGTGSPTSPCPPSNHTITINLTLTFAAS